MNCVAIPPVLTALFSPEHLLNRHNNMLFSISIKFSHLSFNIMITVLLTHKYTKIIMYDQKH